MGEHNISQEKFFKIQTKLMQRYGLDTAGFEEQLKSLGLDKFSGMSMDYEKARKSLSFQEKYKDRIKVKGATRHFVNRMLERKVNIRDAKASLEKPLHVTETKYNNEVSSKLYVGEKATVTFNPDSAKTVTIYKTGTSRKRKYKKKE